MYPSADIALVTTGFKYSLNKMASSSVNPRSVKVLSKLSIGNGSGSLALGVDDGTSATVSAVGATDAVSSGTLLGVGSPIRPLISSNNFLSSMVGMSDSI